MNSPKFYFLFLMIAFIYSLDFTIGFMANKFYFSEKSKANDPLIYSITKSEDGLVVFGSSRAKHHYNTKMMTDSLGISSYNFGYGGQTIYYHEILLRNLLEFHTPKIVILELMTIDFQKTSLQREKGKLNVLLPFSGYSKVINKELGNIDKYHKIKSFSKSYIFNSQAYTIFRNNCLPYNNRLNGYVPIFGDSWPKKIHVDNSVNDRLNYNEEKIDKIYRFIETCLEKRIKLYICVSPVFLKYRDKSPYTDIIQDIERKYGLKVFQFSEHPEFNSKPEYFNDPLHLNASGAKMFTGILIDSLKSDAPNLFVDGKFF